MRTAKLIRITSAIRKSILVAAVVVCHCAISVSATAQSDFHTYPSRTIAEIIQQHSKEDINKPDLIVSADPFPSKTRLTYTGEHRPLDQFKKDFILLWSQTRNLPPERAGMLVEEYRFKEKDREYWIPVLKHLPPLFQEDLKPGVDITVYYFFLGGYNEKSLREKKKDKAPEVTTATLTDKIEWVFALEAYQKPSVATVYPSLSAATEGVEANSSGGDVWIDPRQVRSRAKVVFTGDVRPTGEARTTFIKAWLVSRALAPETINSLSQEVRLREDDKEYWSPVRKTILDRMKKELKPGEEISVLTILAGSISAGQNRDWVFIVGEFSK